MDGVSSTHAGEGEYIEGLGKPERDRPFGRIRRRWESSIKMDLRGIGWGCTNWIHMTQDRDKWRALRFP
jgi:hypothetical protein